MTVRIIKGVGGLYTMQAPDGKIFTGKARGILRKHGVKPAIGDYADISISDGQECVIEKIHERKNMLLRPKAANIDCAVIVFAAADPDINLDLLDRFIILAESRNINEIFICINKCDLEFSPYALEAKRIYDGLYPLYFVSARDNEGIDRLKTDLKSKVSIFAGPSGVGKSSLINRFVPGVNMETGEISEKIKRGRHTTRHIELMCFDDDSYIMDSPGFSSLELEGLDPERLTDYFKEFGRYLTGCYYRDCHHIDEPGCRLKEQVGVNILPERYERYKSVYKELKSRTKY